MNGSLEKTPEPSYNKETENRDNSLLKDILFLFIKIVAIIFVFILVFTFLFGLHRTTDPSMSPSIRDGDLTMFYRLNKTYSPGDTVLLKFEGKRQIRRVVAMPGDRVDISEEGLMINGSLQQELEIYQKTQRYTEGVSFPLTVGEGEVFVLADARENGIDSRIYGTVKTKDTMGKVIAILRRRSI